MTIGMCIPVQIGELGKFTDVKIGERGNKELSISAARKLERKGYPDFYFVLLCFLDTVRRKLNFLVKFYTYCYKLDNSRDFTS